MGTACKDGAEQFSVGLKLLVVDDDVTCLRILEQKLRKCTYTVTTCSQATVALNILRERKGLFDLVLSDVHMPDMDGFKLLELVGLEMDLPVIMMSGDDRTSLVMRGIRHGACDYLIKPIRIEELKNIWQHVVRKRYTVSKEPEEDNGLRRHANDESEYPCVNDGVDGGLRTQKKRKDTKEDDDAELENDDPGTSRKKRVVWSVELHQQFVSAVYQLGIDKAVPKRILELMNVPGLTRENVASHLQKFRLYLKRLSRVAQLHGGLPSPYCAPLDSIPQVGSTVGRFDIQALAASGQIPPNSLAALHADLLDHRTSTVVLPAMDQSSLLQVSLPTSMCTTLDQNIAYGQTLGKCSSIAPNHFSQEFCSAENVQPGLCSWSSKGTTSVVNCDNLSGFASQNGGAIIDIMNHQSRELRQPHEHPQRQSALPEPSRTINVQPSCLVPSYSSSNFQSGNSIGSANQSRSLGGSSNLNYNMLLPQLNNPELDTRRVQDREIKQSSRLGGLSGFGSLFPASFSSGSLNINNGIRVEAPASRSNCGRLLSGLAPNASTFLDSYDATSANFLDQRMPKNTGFFGRATPVPSHIHIDETGLAVNHGDRENMFGENIVNNKVKQEASMNFCENSPRGSSNVATSFS